RRSRLRRIVGVRLKVRVERAELGLKRQDAGRVGDRGVDFRSVADDAGVRDESNSVAYVEAGDDPGLEVSEGPAEGRSLVEDGRPGQTSLERFECEPLEELAIIVGWDAPLLVVVTNYERV